MKLSISLASQASKLARWSPLRGRRKTVQCCDHLFSEEVFHQLFQFVYQAGMLRLPSLKERSFDAHPSNLTQQISGKTLDDEWISSYSAKENQGEQTCRGMLSLQHC